VTEPNNVISGLSPLKWRGSIHSHYSDASFPFEHRQNRVEYFGVDAAGHDNTGRAPYLTSITLFFYNTLYKDAFPQHYNEWMQMLLDGKPGELEHPLSGIYDAVVLGGDARLVASDRAGSAVSIRFEEHIDDPEQARALFLINIPDLAIAAQAADAASSAINIQPPSEAFALTLEEMARAIQSAIFQAQLDALGLINKVKSFVDTMTQTAIAVNSFTATGAIDALTALWSALDDTANNLGNKARKQEGFLTINPTTLDAFARQYDMTLEEAIELNPGAAGSPGVPTGTLLMHYA